MNDLPHSMRASVLTQVKSIAMESRSVPTPRSDEVLVQVSSVGVCGSDVHYYEHGKIGPFVVEEPLILGHEASGVIVAVGDDVAPSRVGERVSIEPQRSCRTCDYCKSGRYNLCPHMEFYATPPIDGAFAEYVTIQDDFAFTLPESVSDNAGALMEPLSVGIAAVQKGNVSPGQSVLIAGGGPIGLILAQVARAYGATTIHIADLDENRRSLVTRNGFHAIDPANESTTELGVDVFFDASGAPPAIVNGIQSTRSGGVAVLVGSADSFTLSLSDVAMREVDVRGIFRYTGTWPIARELLTSGLVDLDALVTHEYGLDDVETALTANPADGALKRIVHPNR